MSDANRVRVAIARNAARDPVVTQAALQAIRNNGQPNLAFAIERIASNELRADRNKTDAISVGATAAGDLPSELSFGNSDLFLESVLLWTFAQNNGLTASKSWLNAAGDGFLVDGQLSLTAVGQTSTVFKVGHIVRLTHRDIGGAFIDGPYEVTANAANILTLAPLASLSTSELVYAPALVAANLGAPAVGTTSEVRVVGVIGAATDIALTQSGGICTLTSTANLFNSAMDALAAVDLRAGQLIKIKGFTVAQATTAGANVYAILSSAAASGATLTFPQPASINANDPGTGVRIEVYFGDVIRNPDENNIDPISEHQFIIEQAYLDHSPVDYQVFLGMAIARLQLELAPRAIALLTPSFLGLNARVATSAEYASAGPNQIYTSAPTITPALTKPIYNTSRNVGRLGLGASNVAGGSKNFVLEATVDINANLEELPAVGVFGAAALSAGELSITGTLNTYFDDLSNYLIVLNDGETTFDSALRSADGRVMGVSLPRIKLNGAPDVPGKNQRTVLNLSYEALLDSTLGYSIAFHRLHYAR